MLHHRCSYEMANISYFKQSSINNSALWLIRQHTIAGDWMRPSKALGGGWVGLDKQPGLLNPPPCDNRKLCSSTTKSIASFHSVAMPRR